MQITAPGPLQPSPPPPARRGAGPVPAAGAVFRRLDVHTLLGVIDERGISQPFFFTLRREGWSDDASRA